MIVTRRMRKASRQAGSILIGTAILVYLGYHALVGSYGLEARANYLTRESILSSDLEKLVRIRDQWQHRVRLLGDPRQIDADILEERSREILNVMAPGEAILRPLDADGSGYMVD